ncbi:hypothetical protein LSTR_LSTR009898 [Laodelphax striatellus]|uniref:Uncharacterized protein n=1 Tax=Laodelphax striatellus TaxID=195883 RepID=A0A482WK33_LAOST|nr:hypothetical protein LSTR_LSTR009898 [Laodelphax striatellus]
MATSQQARRGVSVAKDSVRTKRELSGAECRSRSLFPFPRVNVPAARVVNRPCSSPSRGPWRGAYVTARYKTTTPPARPRPASSVACWLARVHHVRPRRAHSCFVE